MNFGLKVSQDGVDVNGLRSLIIDSKYPQWKCDMTANPKLYGTIRSTSSIDASGNKVIFRLAHGYNYIPSFLAVWNYPSGNDQTIATLGSTYGLGDISILNADFSITTFAPKIDSTEFRIELSSSTAQTNLYAEFRFYIFADDFPKREIGSSI